MGSSFSSCVKKASKDAVISIEESIITKILPIIEKKIEESLASRGVETTKVSDVVVEFTKTEVISSTP